MAAILCCLDLMSFLVLDFGGFSCVGLFCLTSYVAFFFTRLAGICGVGTMGSSCSSEEEDGSEGSSGCPGLATWVRERLLLLLGFVGFSRRGWTVGGLIFLPFPWGFRSFLGCGFGLGIGAEVGSSSSSEDPSSSDGSDGSPPLFTAPIRLFPLMYEVVVLGDTDCWKMGDC